MLGLTFLSLARIAHADPVVTFTQVPLCGSQTLLEGAVSNIANPSQYVIVPYIYRAGWWTKPTFANPTVPLAPAGPVAATFSVDIVSHPNDTEAGYIVAFLVPTTFAPPQESGAAFLPVTLFDHPYAEVTRECDTRVIDAFDRAWLVKESDGNPAGPGPNFFSNSPQNVYIDENGWLHLRIERRQNKWYTAEVIDITVDRALSSPGFGTYLFQVHGDMDLLDPNVVVGLFTWDSFAPEHNYRELDLEFARWGNAANTTNSQYVVQPWDTPGNLFRFRLPPLETITTHTFEWQVDIVDFRSWSGSALVSPPENELLALFSYGGGDIPPPGRETTNARMNLWLFGGSAPRNGQAAEIIVSDFDHSTDTTSVVGIGHESPSPTFPVVLRAFPNPARGPVTLWVESAETRPWDVRVFDVQGAAVRSLGTPAEGSAGLVWDGSDETGRRVPPGVYFAVARAANLWAVRKLVQVH